MAGWVGDLPGMTWDATKNRYFKTPPASAPSAGPSARRNASQLASSIQADSVKQARVSNRAKANGGRGPHKDMVVSGIALKSSRVKADSSRTGAYQPGTARLPRSQYWRLGDMGAHKSYALFPLNISCHLLDSEIAILGQIFTNWAIFGPGTEPNYW